MKRTHWVTLEGDFNWKCVQDNFNESYHLPYVHPQTLSVDERALHGLPVRHVPVEPRPHAHARRRPRPAVPGQAPTARSPRCEQEFKFWEFDAEPYRDDLPGLRVALQQRKRELGASKGYDFSRYSDEQLTDHYHYTVFPNVSFCDEARRLHLPHGPPAPDGDPSMCEFDMWYLTKFPQGVTEYFSNSMRDWVSVDHQVEHQRGKVGEVSCGPGIDQDVAIWSTQQAGLTSRGFRGEYLPDAGAPRPLLPRQPQPHAGPGGLNLGGHGEGRARRPVEAPPTVTSSPAGPATTR